MDQTTYRHAEDTLWQSVGLTPQQRRVHLPALGCEVRVLEVGSGPPVVFVHGAPNAGSTWAPLVARLHGVRAIVVDRPGTGLSDAVPTPLDARSLPGFADGFLADLLDGIAVDRAHVVASSFGSYLALRGAAAHPHRVERMVHLGCPALVAGMRMPPLVRAMASPLRHLLSRMPANAKGTTMSLRQLGHGASLQGSLILDPVIDWMTSLQSHTDTFRHEGELIAAAARPIGGVRPSLSLTPDVLARVTSPTLLAWGDADPFGDGEVATALARALPDARLEMLADAGHLPWLDDPATCAEIVSAHLTASRPQPA